MSLDGFLTKGVPSTVRQRSLNRSSGHTDESLSSIHEQRNVSSGPTNKQAEESGAWILGRAWTVIGVIALVLLVTTLLWQSRWIIPRSGLTQVAVSQENIDNLLDPNSHIDRLPTNLTYQWRISAGYRSPDGVKKRVYLINNEFIGPTIEARSGDWICVEVINGLDDEGVAIHWHGLWMRDYNNMDGAVGITQDPIQAGERFVYRFKIMEDQVGTFWYHAHNQEQRSDGLSGALIVHRHRQDLTAMESSIEEERVLMINDWYHRSGQTALSWYMRPNSMGMEPVPDSILVNGIGYYNCTKAIPARPVECFRKEQKTSMLFDVAKVYRLRIINSGMLAGITLTAKGAVMKVIEVDGGSKVQPMNSDSLGILYPGQRIDVLIRWYQPDEHELQISLDREGFRYANPALTSEQSFPVQVNSGRAVENDFPSMVDGSRGLQEVVSIIPQKVPSNADVTFVLYTTTMRLARLSNIPHGFVNHTTWKPQSPPLLKLPRSKYDSNQLVPFIPIESPALWVDIILNNLDDDHHPFHLHGFSPYVLQTYASGARFGSWNPFEMLEAPGGPLNLNNPVMRDTFLVPRKGYIVLRFRANNPGIWLFHCHVLWHLGSGMAIGFEIG